MVKKRITQQLKQVAQELANEQYHIILVQEGVGDEKVILASLLEMPHCLAQGADVAEALEELKSATYEYILSGLQYGVVIPKPYGFTEGTYAEDVSSFTLSYGLSFELPVIEDSEQIDLKITSEFMPQREQEIILSESA